MDRPIKTTLSLCSGVGWLDEGSRAGLDWLGFDHQPLAYCERDAYAASVLLSRMEDEAVGSCPVWCGDLRDFDATPFRGMVDVLAAGLPCQPYSVAGKQLGNADHRSHGDDGNGPIPQFLRIVSECRPAVVFLENVPPWVRGGWFRPVGEALCGLGYTLESPLFVTAQSVGASHRRERVFVLANREHAERRPEHQEHGQTSGLGRPGRSGDSVANAPRVGRRTCGPESAGLQRGAVNGDAGGSVEHATSERTAASEFGRRGDVNEQTSKPVVLANRIDGRINERERGSDRRAVAGRAGEPVADTSGTRPQERRSEPGDDGAQLAAAERNGVDLFAPGPSGDWHDIPASLWPATEPGLRVFLDGRAVVVDESRADQLRCGGNGCVPLVAAVAFVELMRRVS